MINKKTVFGKIPSLKGYTIETLQKAKREEQIEVMQYWFRNKFENPVESCPVERGEFIYIYGGPYYASDELENEFGNIIPSKIISELVGELELEAIEWSGKPTQEWYEDLYLETIQSDKDPYNYFIESKNKLKSLLETKVDNDLQQDFLRLIYINMITILETYLAETFINTILRDNFILRKFVEGNEDFKKQKLCLNEIFEKYESIEEKVKEELLSIIWHDLAKVKSFYKYSLDIEFIKDLKEIFRAINKRHDFVHRNGKTKKGEEIIISKQEIEELIDQISKLIEDINKQILEHKPDF